MEHADKTREVEEELTDLELADQDAEQVIGGTLVSNVQQQASDATKATINNMR